MIRPGSVKKLVHSNFLMDFHSNPGAEPAAPPGRGEEKKSPAGSTPPIHPRQSHTFDLESRIII